MLNFLTTVDPSSGSQMASSIIMLVAMAAVFYFMLIRPENKRKKEAEQLRSKLKVGDKVTTIGGVTGTVVNVEKFVLETGADQVRIEFQKWALSTNDTEEAAAKEKAEKAAEEKAKAKAAKKAKKNIDM